MGERNSGAAFLLLAAAISGQDPYELMFPSCSECHEDVKHDSAFIIEGKTLCAICYTNHIFPNAPIKRTDDK